MGSCGGSKIFVYNDVILSLWLYEGFEALRLFIWSYIVIADVTAYIVKFA